MVSDWCKIDRFTWWKFFFQIGDTRSFKKKKQGDHPTQKLYACSFYRRCINITNKTIRPYIKLNVRLVISILPSVLIQRVESILKSANPKLKSGHWYLNWPSCFCFSILIFYRMNTHNSELNGVGDLSLNLISLTSRLHCWCKSINPTIMTDG